MKLAVVFLLSAVLAAAQVTIPDGTKILVRLDQTISPSSAEEGQTVELSVTEAVKVGDLLAVLKGARVTGTVTQVQEKRRSHHAAKVDFSIDRVRAVDGQWVALRYMPKEAGAVHAVRSSVLPSAALLLWPAVSALRLIEGKDTTLNRDVSFETFTDRDHAIHLLTAANAMANITNPAFVLERVQ